MKPTRFLMIIVPALFFTGAFIGPMEQLASADGRSGRVRQGSEFRGGADGGRAYSSPARAARQRGDYIRSGSYSRSGDYGRRGSYYRNVGARHDGYYGRSAYYGRGGYYGGGHRHRSHSHVSTSLWFGPSWGWGAWDPFYYPYPYYYRYPYYGPSTTVVIPQEPQQYIMKEPEQGIEETGYWYYCREAKGYYPYVERCPGGWLKVVPQEPPDADKE